MNEDLFQLGIKALIRNPEGKILLLQANTKNWVTKKETHWDLPGGRIHRGATTEETLCREIMEETGISEVKSIQMFSSTISPFRVPIGEDTVGLVLFIYTCKAVADKIQLSSEHINYSWFEPKEAAKLLEYKFPKEFTEKVGQL